MLTWKTLHVLSMVMMVTAFIGPEIFYAAAIRRRDVAALAFVQRTTERSGIGFIALGALVAGIVFGLLTAATGGFDFVAPWLLVSYLLVGAFLVNAFVTGVRVVRVARRAVEAEGQGAPDEELVRDMAATRAVSLVVVNAMIFAAVIVVMVLKPF